MRNIIIPLVVLSLSGCSTYREGQIAQEFPPPPELSEFSFEQVRTAGAIFNANASGIFASDRRAHKTGDILTIRLTESFSASKNNAAASAKSDSYALTLPNFDVDIPLLGPSNLLADGAKWNSGTEQSFAGSGQAAQSNSLTGLVSVIVTRVYDNGTLAIRGQKHLTLNQGDEYIRVTGLVRPEDIGPNNIVSSDRVANAQISYVGAGQLADSGKTGWFSRMLRAFSPL